MGFGLCSSEFRVMIELTLYWSYQMVRIKWIILIIWYDLRYIKILKLPFLSFVEFFWRAFRWRIHSWSAASFGFILISLLHLKFQIFFIRISYMLHICNILYARNTYSKHLFRKFRKSLSSVPSIYESDLDPGFLFLPRELTIDLGWFLESRKNIEFSKFH